ncbi:hypothetical protein GOP47_0025829 [Adiantum capillus-veneris]|uniref:Uncharacterized protein n=1 Tax=Adiantum capillus-veneris TaxID=13818 RepID=A0A9D4U179_ADICA|nr:hypothetical protein GOP47_0025829 [Adiantum capillus-veneris]
MPECSRDSKQQGCRHLLWKRGMLCLRILCRMPLNFICFLVLDYVVYCTNLGIFLLYGNLGLGMPTLSVSRYASGSRCLQMLVLDYVGYGDRHRVTSEYCHFLNQVHGKVLEDGIPMNCSVILHDQYGLQFT